MSQPTGIAINNTHLLRAAMLFMVLGVIGPGLFQLKPPQWFGGSGDAGTMEMAAPATAPPKTSPDNALLPEQPVRGPALSPPTVTQPAAPPETSLETQMAAVPAPVTGRGLRLNRCPDRRPNPQVRHMRSGRTSPRARRHPVSLTWRPTARASRQQRLLQLRIRHQPRCRHRYPRPRRSRNSLP